jgi:hypothetical protein
LLPNPADQQLSIGHTALRRGLLCAVLGLGLGSACSESGDPSEGLAPARLGQLHISVEGLPSGAAAAVSISSSQGYQRAVSGSETLSGLTVGSYAVAAVEVVIGGDRYAPALASQTVSVTGGATATLQVAYALTTARLELSLEGLPAGTAISLRLTGPGGYSRTLEAGGTITGLIPGTYTLVAPGVITAGDQYRALPESREVVLAAPDTVPVLVAVAYSVVTGKLVVEVAGVPAGTAASVHVTGPALDRVLTQTDTLVGLIPGVYSVAAGSALSGGHWYQPTPGQQTKVVVAGSSPEVVSVSYSIAPASLTIVVSGLPAGAAANVAVTGPGGYNSPVTASRTLTGLAAGAYAVVAGTVTAGGVVYSPQVPVQNLTLNGGGSTSVTVAYPVPRGLLTVTISGLPGGTPSAVVVTGPGGFTQSLAASATLTGLVPGSYAVNASNVVSGTSTYQPAPAGQSTSVPSGGTISVTVSYTVGAVTGPDLSIDGAYLTQATQRYDGSVPLVAGRDAFLRVFALASLSNALQPSVRVRLYHGAALVQTYTLPAPAASVPTSVDESSLSRSWNVLVPAALVQPGLKLLADVDPGNAVAEPNETNNQFPGSGTAASVEVRAVPTFAVRFVPVVQQLNGLQGAVAAANQEAFLADLKRQLPVGAYDAEVRAPYTTSAPVLQSSNSNNAWSTILSELLALRSADASSRYYYGVVKVGYSSGVAGMGYVGGSARTAVGWDFLPSGAHVMAHELGHNMGRTHAPCGGPAGVDPAFPYPGGEIGTWGMDVSALLLKAPTLRDLMTYCGPNWISDYNWTAMLTYRQSGPTNAPAATAGDGLLFWGRIGPTGVVLEPAFQVPAGPELGPRPGANRLELLRADGSLLRSVAFDAVELADLSGGSEQHFAFVVPLDGELATGLAAARVVSGQGAQSDTRLALSARDADPVPLLSRPAPGQIELRWDVARFPMVLIRDAGTGQVLSFARGGVTRLQSGSQDFELGFSDGVRTLSRHGRLLR